MLVSPKPVQEEYATQSIKPAIQILFELPFLKDCSAAKGVPKGVVEEISLFYSGSYKLN
jgi:hypothetical protein